MHQNTLDWLLPWRSIGSVPLGEPIMIRLNQHIAVGVVYHLSDITDVTWHPLVTSIVDA